MKFNLTVTNWLNANISPIYKGKKSDCSNPANYHLASLTSIVCKLFISTLAFKFKKCRITIINLGI